MHYTFVPMTRGYADAIVAHWKYGGEYSVYDYTNEAEHMLDPSAWGVGLFAALDEDGELVGELSIEFLNESGHYTEYEQYGDHGLISSRELWIGFGLRPDRVGHGLGSKFADACAWYAVARWDYRGEYVRLGVATFNQRAIKAYERAGFQAYDHSVGDIGGQEFQVLYMRKRLDPE